MSNTIWKSFEKFIGKAIGTDRIPLSGRNNIDDDGNRRIGDICMPGRWNAMAECKTRKDYPKSGIWPRIIETIEDAEKSGKKHWFHFERRKGNKQIFIIAVNKDWIVPICNFIGEELERRSNIYDNNSKKI